MVSQEIIRDILGVVGNVTSAFLFLSPIPTFWNIYKSKSTLEFHNWPYLAGVLNCVFWIFYAMPFVHPHSTFIATINSAGLFLYFIYLGVFFYYLDTSIPEKSKERLKMIGILVGEAIFVAGIVAVTILFFHDTKSRTNFTGAVCVVFGIILYGSPLSVVFRVIATKSVEFLPFWISVTGFCNGVIWATYALLPLDYYVLTGNGIGAILSAIQLLMFVIYPKRGEKANEGQP